jgi:hypothetical protein
MDYIEAYCPECDEIRPLKQSRGDYYTCHHSKMPFLFVPYSGYFGARECHSQGTCSCNYGRYVTFGEVPPTCRLCKLPRKIDDYDRLMRNFTRQMWRVVRDTTEYDAFTLENLRRAFPRRFTTIVAESKEGNVKALAPHLPPVLANIVVEYFGDCHDWMYRIFFKF